MSATTPSSAVRARARGGAALGAAVLTAALLAPAAPANAQDTYTYSIGVFGGVGGSVDEDAAGFGNAAYQLAFGMVIEPEVQLRLRIGGLGFGAQDTVAELADPSLAFVTLGGEYKFDEGFYVSGIYGALGAYRLRGRLPSGAAEEETTFGVAVGATGEFKLSRHLAIEAELSGHYVSSDYAEFFATALVGLSYRTR